MSIALTWAVYLLAKHPSVQSRLRNELRCNLPAADGISISEQDNLPYILENSPILNGVCNKTLRLYPSAPVAVRVSVRDTSIMGHYVPEGTRLIIAPWAVNRSPELWGPQAGAFMPHSDTSS